MNNIFNQSKIVFSGVILALIIILSGAIYSYFSYSSTAIDTKVLTDNNFFKILKVFQDQKIDFSNMTNILTQTFDELEDTRNIVNPDGKDGRKNPFSL